MGADAVVTVTAKGKDEGGSKVLEDVGSAAVDAKKKVDGLGDTTGFDELGTEVLDAKIEIERLLAAFLKAERAFQTAELDESFDKAGDEAKRLRQEVVRTGKAVADFADKNTGIDATSKAFNRVRASTKRARNELERFQKKAGTGFGGAIKSFTSLRTAIGAVQIAFGLALGVRLVEGLASASEAAVKLNAQLQLITPVLKANLGGSDAAAAGYKVLEQTSDRLKVTITSLAQNYVQLTAATKGTVIAGETTDRLFQSITAAGRALGASNEDISRAFLGLSQAAGGANVQMQEVRQITEAIPGLFAAWAKELGLTSGELRKLIATGKVTADQLGVVSDAAERLEGGALAEQLKTIAGQMRAFEVASQNVQKALGEGLEPGLRELFATLLEGEGVVAALAGALGRGLGAEISEVNGLLRGAKIQAEEAFEALNKFGGLGDVIAQGLGLDRILDDLNQVPEAAVEAFEAIEKEALKAATGIESTEDSVKVVAESFGDLPEAAKKAFRELSKAAGIDAKTREKIAQELADDVAEITERSFKLREALQEGLVRAARAGAKERLKAEQDVAKAQNLLAEEAIRETRRLVEERIRLAKVAAAAERLAAEERIKTFDEFVQKATASERERVEAQSAASESIEALDENLAAKRLKIQEEYVAAYALEEDKRADAVKAVEEKARAFAEESVRKRLELSKKLLEEKKKDAEEEKKLAKEVADEVIAQAQRVRDAAKAPEEGAADIPGGDITGGSAIAQTTVEIGAATQSLEALRAEAERLQSIGAQGAGLLDPAGILRTRQAFDDAKFATQQFAAVATESAAAVSAAQEELNTRAQAVLEAIARELEERLKLKTLTEEQIAAAEIFSGVLSSQIDTLAQLAEQGIVTNEDIQALAETFSLYSDETAPASVEANQLIQESLTALAEKTKEQTEATEAGTKAIETEIKVVKNAAGQIEILEVRKQDLKKADEEAVKPTEELTEAFEAEGVAAGAAAGPTGELATNLDAVKEGAEGAGGSVGELATAAEQLSQVTPPDELAAAITSIGRDAPGAADGVNAIAEALQAVNDKLDELRKVVAAVAQLKIEAAAAAQELNNAATAAQNLANTEQGL